VWWFRALVVAHLLVWPLAATLTRPNPSLDMGETLFWGHEWRMGYTKHPPLPSWIAETVAVATGRALWAQYLLAHAAVVLAFWAVWRLAREMVSPRLALLAVALLECCPFYSVRCHELNNNVGLYPCWALAVLFLYWALRTGRTRCWLAAGICLGLGMLTKYTTGILAATLLGFGLADSEARRWWRHPGPYLAIAAAVLLFLPHVWCAASQGFATLRYAAAQVVGGPGWIGRVLNPLEFLAEQLGILAAVPAVLLVATGGKPRLRQAAESPRWPRTFLACVALAPLACHVAVAVLANRALRPVYGSPLWLWAGLLAVVVLEIPSDPARWRRIWIAWGVAVTALGAGFTAATVAAPYLLHKPARCLFPGRELAARVAEVWKSRYSGPLPIVAGDYFLAGSVAFFHPDRPRVYESGNEPINDTAIRDCPWLSDDEFRRRGGVILWDLDADPAGLRRDVLRRFRVREIVKLPPLDYLTRAKLPPVRIGVAIVPPGP
jgi:4-amino-4-deoxy-L-arabinose transferase-like glycosyltransferase